MAQQQRETLVSSVPACVKPVIDQTLIRAGYRKGNVHQQVAAWEGNGKSCEPWPRTFPKGSLPARNQPQHTEKASEGAFVRFQQISQDRVALILIEKRRNQPCQRPDDPVHGGLPIGFPPKMRPG